MIESAVHRGDTQPQITVPKLTVLSVRLTVQSMAVGLFVWCGVLSLVIEEFFKPSYALWMIGSSQVLVIVEAILRTVEVRREGDAGQLSAARPWYDLQHVIYIIFVGVIALWLGMELGASFGLYHYAWAYTFRSPLFVWGLPSALLYIASSGLMFGSPRRRYSLRNRLIALRLAIQSLLAGAALFYLLNLIVEIPSVAHFALQKIVAALLVVHALFVAAIERVSRRYRCNAAQASKHLLGGTYATWFWVGGLLVGHVLPVLIAARELPKLNTFSILAALFGAYAYQHAFVLADRRALNEATNPTGGDDSGPDFP